MVSCGHRILHSDGAAEEIRRVLESMCVAAYESCLRTQQGTGGIPQITEGKRSHGEESSSPCPAVQPLEQLNSS